MTRIYILLVLFVLMLNATACDSNSLDADADYRVTYTVTATGEGTATAISYRDGNGAVQSVTNPTLPWSQRVSMRSGGRAWVSVDGTVLSGAFELALRAVNGDNVITLNTGCATGTDEVYPATCDGVSVESPLP